MRCFSQHRLEAMIRKQSAVGSSEQSHLLGCDRCRERYLALAALQLALLSASAEPGDSIVAAVHSGGEIVLRPLHAPLGGIPASPRLAAQGEQPDDLYLVSSFANAELGMIGRLLYNRQSRHLALYLITESGQIPAGLKVTLDGGRLSGYTSNQGSIDFGDQPEGLYDKVEVHSPRGVCDLTRTPTGPAARSRQHLILPDHPCAEIELAMEHRPEGWCYELSCPLQAGLNRPAELEIIGITSKRILAARTHNGHALLQIGPDEEMQKIHIY